MHDVFAQLSLGNSRYWKPKHYQDKKHSENADTSTSETLDLEESLCH